MLCIPRSIVTSIHLFTPLLIWQPPCPRQLVCFFLLILRSYPIHEIPHGHIKALFSGLLGVLSDKQVEFFLCICSFFHISSYSGSRFIVLIFCLPLRIRSSKSNLMYGQNTKFRTCVFT